MKQTNSPLHTLLGLAGLLFASLSPAVAQDVGFGERFALAQDRAAAIEELVPGTEQYYYYSCLHLQNTGELSAVPPLLKLWRERHGATAFHNEIRFRQALLNYSNDPSGTFEFLRKNLNLRFNHERAIAGEDSPLPARLDPTLVGLEAWTTRALARHRNSIAGFGPSMLETVATMELDGRKLRQLLERLERPDIPGLAALVVRDLQEKSSSGFGSLGIHNKLLLAQLEDCISLRPQLLNDSTFIAEYVQRLAPSADVDWRQDTAEREAYLERLWSFASRLSPSRNAFKAHVLQHRLQHDLAGGVFDRARLLEFLRLPRQAPYVSRDFLASSGQRSIIDSPGTHPTQLGPAGKDETLVRTYLEHFFQTDATWDAFSPYLDLDYLKRVFAETKILAGEGDMERWYSLIGDSAYYERLEKRVEIDFTPGARMHFAAEESVTLQLDTKNVETLLVKVFEIDALAFARANGKLVDASIDLDGLVAGSEATYTYDEPALRRVRRSFDFPQLARPGVYVIDFIGGGLSSRAVIHKGQLHLRGRLGSAGHVFQVLDSAGKAQQDALLYLGRQRYAADEEGEILVPYSTKAETKTLLIQSGPLVGVQSFYHRAESYGLRAGFHIEQEALLEGGTAQLLVRADLRVNGAAADVGLLENVVLTLRGRNLNRTWTSFDVQDIELTADRELIHEFQVPKDLVQLSVSLRAEIENLSNGKREVLLTPERGFWLNRIDTTTHVESPILGRDEDGYFIDVLGKNGEPRTNRVLALQLTRRGFTDALDVQLKSDTEGRVRLGELPGVVSVRVNGFPGGSAAWELSAARRTFSRELHGREWQAIRTPYLGAATEMTPAVASLFELRDGKFMADRFSHLDLADGFLQLRGLPAGDYELLLKESDTHVRVRVAGGSQEGAWVVGKRRALELQAPALQIQDARWTNGELQIQLSNANPSTRVHVFATRFDPAQDAYEDLLSPAARARRVQRIASTESTYDSGRQIGEEYRYILERRLAKKYPGNMLARPGLLLNPWAIEDSETAISVGGGAGGKFGGRRNPRAAGGAAEDKRARRPQGAYPGTFPNLNFLASASVALTNLQPDADGQIVIAGDELGAGQHIRVLVMDEETTIESQLQRPAQTRDLRDRRLHGGLAADSHFSEERQIEFLATGDTVSIQDGTSAEARVLATLGDVFQLYRTLRPAAQLEALAFLTSWPSLTVEEKREKYSKFACHEMHVFLFHKDREFFESTIRPYLANKADKTFIDRWLLEEDLSGYAETWAFAQLNVFEQVLLGRRIGGLRKRVLRSIQDRVELSPPSEEELDALYAVTLVAGDLERAKNDPLSHNDDFFLGHGETRAAGRSAGGGGGGPSSPGPTARSSRTDAAPSEEDADEAVMAGAPVLFDREIRNKDSKRRKQVRTLFRGLHPTEQYAEHNYWHELIENQNAGLIGPNAFWMDFAEADPAAPFRSIHFAQATGNLAEMWMALAVLDLPFEAGEHDMQRTDNTVNLVAASPLILVRTELAEAQAIDGGSSLLVGQQFFPWNDRYEFDGEQSRERRIQEEFLVGTPYGCRVVVTNPSPEAVRLQVLMQVPEGSMPIQNGFITRSVPIQLAAYGTYQVEFGFYFPTAGDWSHYPAHATRDAAWLSAAAALPMHVVLEPTSVDTSSWDHISQRASQQELMAYLAKTNLLRLDLERIAWRLRERASFDEVVQLLRERNTFNALLWSFGIEHGDARATREYLEHQQSVVQICGPLLHSPLLDIDPVAQRTYQRLEFRPLINARAHPEGQTHRILNGELASQYASLTNILAHKQALDAADWISVTHYLLLQDRIEEAIASFARADPAQLTTRIQYDYMRAYLDFFSERQALARSIAEGYSDHPVPHWRARFAEILAQLDEAEGRSPGASAGTEERPGQDALAASEPSLELEVVANHVSIRHKNLERVEVRYYIMDVEFLFSTSPFVQQSAGSFNYVKPNHSDLLEVERNSSALDFELPAQFQAANVLVEVRAAGLVERHAHYANTMAVQWIENYGQLKVTSADNGTPLARVYVKVFARTASGVAFHKDGYTDLRGRFDYVSVSGTNRPNVERYAVLVQDDDNGAVIRELNPPTQ